MSKLTGEMGTFMDTFDQLVTAESKQSMSDFVDNCGKHVDCGEKKKTGTKYTMTVHEGLAELKTLGARIEKEITSNVFVAGNKHANTKMEGLSVADFSKNLKSSMQKVDDLIKRRNAIKRAITKSNAVTEVTIKGDDGKTVTMTVAELIEYKNAGLTIIDRYANVLSQQYKSVMTQIKRNNDNLSDAADRYVTGLFGSKEGISSDVIETTRKSYIEANTLDLIDPNNIQDKIEKLREECDFYNTKVDAALSTSNAITVIEFEY